MVPNNSSELPSALKGIKRKPFTKEHIQNMIKNHVGFLGKVPWNKGKKNCYTESAIGAMSKAKKGKHTSLGTEFKKGNVCWKKRLCKEVKNESGDHQIV